MYRQDMPYCAFGGGAKISYEQIQIQSSKDIDEAGQTNEVRASRAEKAVREGFQIRPKDELEYVNAADLISDTFHLCDRNGWDVEGVISIAIANCRIGSESWSMYWCDSVRQSRYFLASARMEANASVEKFWNSSMKR
jgi:hypothetical protein